MAEAGQNTGVDGAYKNIAVSRSRRVVTLTLDRAAKMNPLDWDTVRELARAFAACEADPETEVVVITGSGKAFSAGGDLDKYIDIYRVPDEFRAFLRDFFDLLDRIERSELIVIAAVNGVCVAGGLELILACDVVITAEEAKIADGHLNFGQLPGAGGSQRLPRAVGIMRAKELILSGRFIDGREAQAIGLASLSAPLADLERTIREFTEGLLAKSFAGRRGAKRLVNEGLRGDVHTGLQFELDFVHRYATEDPDATEGLMAFKEKRAPRFRPRDEAGR